MYNSYTIDNLIESHYITHNTYHNHISYYLRTKIYYYTYKIHITYTHDLEQFLTSTRPLTKFINTDEEIEELTKLLFKIITKKEFPNNLIIKVCSEQEFEQLHPNPAVLGISLNTGTINKIFVRASPLDKLIITIGHEIGHLLTPPLNKKHDEEAKAFAFEFAWVKAIKDYNIHNLAPNLKIPLPANNGLHDIAFNFVANLINQGLDPLNIFWYIIYNGLTVGDTQWC